jgi:hypothetical protein
MNLLDVRLGCNEQRTKHRPSATRGEVDVVIVRPAAWTFVVDRTTQLNCHDCTDRPGVDVRFETQYGLMHVRRAFGMHEPEGSVVLDEPHAHAPLVLPSEYAAKLGQRVRGRIVEHSENLLAI